MAGEPGLEPGRDEAGSGGVNAGMINLVKQIANNHGADGMTVHTVVQGPMDTARLRRIAATIAAQRGVPEADILHGTVLHLDAGGLRAPT